MSSFSETIDKWKEVKEQIAILEKKSEKYKDIIEKEMLKKGLEILKGDKYQVKKVTQKRSYVSKNTLPPELWKKYCATSIFNTYYLSKVKGSPKKIRKSR